MWTIRSYSLLAVGMLAVVLGACEQPLEQPVQLAHPSDYEVVALIAD